LELLQRLRPEHK
jgi:hypothetical protein